MSGDKWKSWRGGKAGTKKAEAGAAGKALGSGCEHSVVDAVTAAV